MKRIVLMIAVPLVLTGCRWGGKPYARDPLMQNKRAIPGDPDRVPALCPSDHPAPPTPPSEATPVSDTK